MNGPSTSTSTLSIGQLATTACLMEVTVPKPGNVHRSADFEDVSYFDFVLSAVAIGPAMQEAAVGTPLGATVLEAIRATRSVVATNTNLGSVLLLAPLCMAPPDVPLTDGVRQVLDRLTPFDAENVYVAIRLAQPGGLGEVSESDVSGDPPEDLIEAMSLAAERDLVAAQYATGFTDIFGCVVPWLEAALSGDWSVTDAVVRVHLQLMSLFPDSLIARKCGPAVSQKAAEMAQAALDAGQPGETAYQNKVADLDFWLRSDGHRRNPGTTADMLAAGLFVVLREGTLEPPYRLFTP